MPNYDAYTENLADFGMREIEELRDILTAWLESGLPDDFYDEGVKPAFNRNSGYVFLTNDEYQVCMEVDGKLESFYTSPYYGTEGFYEDLLEEAEDWDADNADEDLEWLRDIAESRGDTEGVEKLNALIDAFNANNGIEESTRTSKQAVTAAYGTWHSFYGLPDVEFRVVNDMSDPDLSYNGEIYNYYDVEDALWSEYKEYCEENGCIPDEDDFAAWVAEDHDRVYNWLADLTPTGRKRAGKGQIQRSVRSSKSAKRRFTVTAAKMSDDPTADADAVEDVLKQYEGSFTNPKTGWSGTVTIKRDDKAAKDWSRDSDGIAYLWRLSFSGGDKSSSGEDLIVYWPQTMDGGQKFTIHPESGAPQFAKSLDEFKKLLRKEYSYLKKA